MSTLDQLLDEAKQADQAATEAELKAKELSLFSTDIYKKHAQEMLDLVKPLKEVLPSTPEYARLPYSNYGKVPDSAAVYAQICRVNPGQIITDMTKAGFLDELDDDQFDYTIDLVVPFAWLWDSKKASNAKDLAMNLIVQTVLQDDELRERVFAEARENLYDLIKSAPMVTEWADYADGQTE